MDMITSIPHEKCRKAHLPKKKEEEKALVENYLVSGICNDEQQPFCR